MPDIFARLEPDLDFVDIFWNVSSIKFDGNTCSGTRRWYVTKDGPTDGRTDMTKLVGRFSRVCERT